MQKIQNLILLVHKANKGVPNKKVSNVGASRFLPVNGTTDYLCGLALEMEHLFFASP
jgi:hypothetical protein